MTSTTTRRGRLRVAVLSHDRVRRWHHARSIRTARWTRRTIQIEHRNSVVKNRWLVAIVLVGGAAIAGATMRWLPAGPIMRGFFGGQLASSALVIIWVGIVSSPTTLTKQSGVDAEIWTAQELRRLRRSGWQLLNGLPLFRGDVDHVMIGHGRVLVVETKWSAMEWNLKGSDPRIGGAADQVRSGARHVQKFLATKGIETTVQGMVVLWGPVSADPNDIAYDRRGERVAIVHGHDVRQFFATLTARAAGDSVDERLVFDILADAVELRVAYEEKRNPTPPKVLTQAWIVFGGVLVGSVAVLLVLQVATGLFGTWSAAFAAIIGGLVAIAGAVLAADRRGVNRLLTSSTAVAFSASMVWLAARVVLAT